MKNKYNIAINAERRSRSQKLRGNFRAHNRFPHFVRRPVIAGVRQQYAHASNSISLTRATAYRSRGQPHTAHAGNRISLTRATAYRSRGQPHIAHAGNRMRSRGQPHTLTRATAYRSRGQPHRSRGRDVEQRDQRGTPVAVTKVARQLLRPQPVPSSLRSLASGYRWRYAF
jgi:hypothetical protein